MNEFLTDTNIILIVFGILFSWAFTQIKAAIKGTALESELGELLEIAVKAGEDGKVTPAEAREIGREGMDSLKTLRAFISDRDIK